MKLQIDTTSKIVKVEENVKVLDLINVLKKMLPGEWEKFTLETHTTIVNWHEPIIIKHYPYYEPYRGPMWYECNSTNNKMLAMNKADGLEKSTNYMLKEGVFNVEVDEKEMK
jgi:hypothetical protein